MSEAVTKRANQVEKFHLPGEPARIFHKAIESPVRGIGESCRSPGGVRPVSLIVRVQSLCAKATGMVLLKVLEEHVSIQVHARPVFLEQVANNAHTRQGQPGFALDIARWIDSLHQGLSRLGMKEVH